MRTLVASRIRDGKHDTQTHLNLYTAFQETPAKNLISTKRLQIRCDMEAKCVATVVTWIQSTDANEQPLLILSAVGFEMSDNLKL